MREVNLVEIVGQICRFPRFPRRLNAKSDRVNGFDNFAELLPGWRKASASWPVDLSADPLLRKTFDLLRSKWSEVPFTAQERTSTAHLQVLDDNALMQLWNRGFRERAPFSEGGWAHCLYRDVFRGRKVLDIGSGLGFDTIYFAEHGANVTFVDIALPNLSVVERVCRLKHLKDVAFCHLEDLSSLSELPLDFDFIYAQGSLINAPLEAIRMELSVLLRHLPVGGRIVMLGYPRARWERDGRLPETEWGRITDGGAPWMEWLDIDKVMWCLWPANFEVILNFELHNGDFNWFDLIRVDGETRWRPALATLSRQPDIPTRASRSIDLLAQIQPVQQDWESAVSFGPEGVSVTTGPRRWSYACLFALDPNLAADADSYYWIRVCLQISEGVIGVGMLKGQSLLHERTLETGTNREIFLPLIDTAAEWLVLRNVAVSGASQAIISSVELVAEPKPPAS